MNELAALRREGAKSSKATPGAADFLRETYLESEAHGRVVLRELAQRLGVSAPAISRMAQRLVQKGYLKREGACGLELHESGRRVALKSLRKTRIFEVYLVQELGYSWDQVFPLAVSSSHHLDDELIERMWIKLNKPLRCPHGDAIPTRDGHMEQIESVRLSDATAGTQGTLSHVASHDPELLRYLTTLGLLPGLPIQIVSRAPFGGPIRVRVQVGDAPKKFENEHVIGKELAGVINISIAPGKS